MKWLLLLSIRLYWRYTPPSRRRACLFRQSCSRHVYAATETGGAAVGIAALWRRFRQCRTPSGALFDGDSPRLLLADGATVCRQDLSQVGESYLLQWLAAIPSPPAFHRDGGASDFDLASSADDNQR